MLSAFVNTFKIAELRQRILFTLGLVFICRVVATVPLPAWMRPLFVLYRGAGGAGGGLSNLNLFSGERFTMFGGHVRDHALHQCIDHFTIDDSGCASSRLAREAM